HGVSPRPTTLAKRCRRDDHGWVGRWRDPCGWGTIQPGYEGSAMSSRRARHRRGRGGGSKSPGLLLNSLTILLILVIGLGGVGTATAYAFVNEWLKDLPDISSPDAFKVAMPTRIYSADGELLARLYLEDRRIVKYSQIATDLPDAIVAVEDERFYDHR